MRGRAVLTAPTLILREPQDEGWGSLRMRVEGRLRMRVGELQDER